MKKISLCGDWEFHPDLNVPECAKKPYPIQVPGSWKTLPGLLSCEAGRYSRSFILDHIQIKNRVILKVGGVCRKAEVRLNGMKVGTYAGLQSPFAVDISDAVRCGENQLEVFVDGRRNPGEYLGHSSIYELVPLHFEGLYGPVFLELSAHQALTGLYTPIEPATGKAIFIFDSHNNSDEDVDGQLELDVSRGGISAYHGTFHVCLKKGDGEFRLELPLAPFSLWSPEKPTLYDIRAELTVGDSSDTFLTRTGLKRFETRETDFYLNGEPYYILGYGDDFVFPDGMPDAIHREFYFPGIRRAKEYGFNFARHHSHFPFEAYLDAADELGLLVQPELALANVPREKLDTENAAIFLSEWRALIRAYRHHPCIAFWCGGNEMEWGFPFSGALYMEAKRLDPYRPVESTDGNFMACDVDDTFDFAGIVPAEYTDYLPYRELEDMFTRDCCGKPQIVHEMGNYATVYAIHDLPRFEKTEVAAGKITEFAGIVQKKNCQELYERAMDNSLALQKLCHKLNIEKVRLSPYFSGYHLWTLIDYYETTQGLLNSFYEDKAFTAKEFTRINSQCVLLWDTKTYVFRAGETADFELKLSKFGSDARIDGKISLSLYEGAHEIAVFHENKSFCGHGLLDAFRVKIRLPASDRERICTLSVQFEYADGVISNSWELFSVPQIRVADAKEIYIHYLSRYLFANETVPLRHFTIPQPIGRQQLLVTEHLYGGMLEAVENGAALLLFAGPDSFCQTVLKNSFKTPWWDPGNIWYLNHTNNAQLSCVVEDAPATGMLPYKGAWRMDLFDVLEQAPAVNIDALHLDVEPLIYGVDTKLSRLAYLFQFSLGKGKCLVCLLNHARKDMEHISVDYMIKSLINYSMSDAFSPEKRLTLQQLQAALN